MQKEAKARIKINELLQNSGWRFFDNEKGFPFVVLEAKSEDKDPLDGKEQAREFKQSDIKPCYNTANLFDKIIDR